jgi:translation initiation factor IF-2
LKHFSLVKNIHVVGCRITDGTVVQGAMVRIIHDDVEVGRGKITELQHNKVKMKTLDAVIECGISIETKADIEEHDSIEVISEVTI